MFIALHPLTKPYGASTVPGFVSQKRVKFPSVYSIYNRFMVSSDKSVTTPVCERYAMQASLDGLFYIKWYQFKDTVLETAGTYFIAGKFLSFDNKCIYTFPG